MLQYRLLNMNLKRNVFGSLGLRNLYTCNTNLFVSETTHKKAQAINNDTVRNIKNPPAASTQSRPADEIIPSPRVVPMLMTNKDPVVLSFDDVPGPKTLKYISNVRQYISEFGTQVMANALTIGINIGTYMNKQKPLKNLSTLFDEYGPVVRFVSPVGGDIVLLNNPEHIQKVYATEGEYPIRSALDSLETFRRQHKNNMYMGLYSSHGQDWSRQRMTLTGPLEASVTEHVQGINDICDCITTKLANLRNHRDEITQDLYKELHKWAFDSMGLIMFSRRFNMLQTDVIYNQCDMAWLYHSLDRATESIVKCESGLQMWKIVSTPAWHNLVKYCDSLDNLIGKHVIEAEQKLSVDKLEESGPVGSFSLINTMLISNEKMSVEDITTVLVDMLLIGVNTITSTMSFLMYYLGKHQRVQRTLYKELDTLYPNFKVQDMKKLKDDSPYLQACIKETLRLVPPIPLLTRILPKNITLDRYNIPRGTLLIMSTQDAALKESNYDDATTFRPERWLSADAKDYHAFASIPFGYGNRKCLGQNIAETLMSLLTMKLLQKYKLEYHYGDIHPTRTFIAKPNKQLKIRFIDRI